MFAWIEKHADACTGLQERALWFLKNQADMKRLCFHTLLTYKLFHCIFFYITTSYPICSPWFTVYLGCAANIHHYFVFEIHIVFITLQLLKLLILKHLLLHLSFWNTFLFCGDLCLMGKLKLLHFVDAEYRRWLKIRIFVDALTMHIILKPFCTDNFMLSNWMNHRIYSFIKQVE